MKNMRKWVVLVVVMAVMGTAVAAFAATGISPAGIASELTGRSEDELYSERLNGKSICEIINDAGKLEEFKTRMLEERKAYLNQQVKDGKLTQEQADGIIAGMAERQENCDGSGIGAGNGQCLGAGGGSKRGGGMGNRAGRGNGCLTGRWK